MSDIQTLAETGQAAELKEETRARALESLYYFTKVVLGYNDLTSSLHKQVCDFVQHNRTRRQVIMLPRGHFKSTIFSKAYPIWRIIHYKLNNYDAALVLARETDKMAARALREIKGHIESNQILRWLFPEIIPPDFNKTKWADHEIILPRVTPRQEATITAVGVGAAVTGEHYDEQIKDDLIGFEASKSTVVMETAINWHQISEGLFRSPADGYDMVIGTHWTDTDLYNWIEENEPDYTFWKMSCYDDNGNPIFPERYSRETLEKIAAKQKPYIFSCQYQNDPIPKGGGDFKSEWLREFEVVDNKYIHMNPNNPAEVMLPTQLHRVGYFDPRHSEEGIKGTAEHALVITGRDIQTRILILETWAKPIDVGTALHQMQKMNDRWHCQWYYEGVGAQKHLANAIAMLNIEATKYMTCAMCKKEGIANPKPHRYIHAEVDTVSTRVHKDERIRTNLQTLPELWIRKGNDRAKNQIQRFPNGKLKDIIDAISSAIPYLRTPRDPGDAKREEAEKQQAMEKIKPYTDTAFVCG